MLWHFFGLQGGGKSWGVSVWAEDMHIKKGYKVYANFWLEFGKIISIRDLMDFKYDNCVIILDEAYGVADSHQTSKANDNLSEVIHQSRKKRVEVFFATQLEGDLYKRIRTSAHRKVLCENLGTEEVPILRFIITNQHNRLVENPKIFDTVTVRGAYHLYNTDEVIMPMHLNPEFTFDWIKEIYGDCETKKTFSTLLNDENKFITRDIGDAVYDLMKAEKYDRVKRLLKLK